MKKIEVKRNGELIKKYDFYKLLLEGDTSQDMRLQEGDTIFYPLIESVVRIDGSVQRPGKYEIFEECCKYVMYRRLTIFTVANCR